MRAHFIAGSGSRGCLFDAATVHPTYTQAVEELTSRFDLGRDRRRKLTRESFMELSPRRDGADYCQIEECDCAEPWTHDDDMTEDTWRYDG